MNKFGNLLWRIFSATMIFAWGIDRGHSEDCPTTDPKIALYSDENADHAEKKVLCSAGTYVYSCGPAIMGTAWLKGMTRSKDLDANCKIVTPDFYSYTSTTAENLENLRKFFAGEESINYTNSDASPKTVDPAGYKEYRDQILIDFCTNTSGFPSDITCKTCPNNATTAASTVDITYSNGKILSGSWKIQTIADCYMDEFQDSTGTYVYAQYNNESNEQPQAQPIYYSGSSGIYGSTLYYR